MPQLFYYKKRQTFITKYVRFFITKCDSYYNFRRFYYKMWQLLQNITLNKNCDSTFFLRKKSWKVMMTDHKQTLSGIKNGITHWKKVSLPFFSYSSLFKVKCVLQISVNSSPQICMTFLRYIWMYCNIEWY